MLEGTTLERVLTVVNDGDETLLIRNVATSCGCTVARLSQSAVAPHDSVTVAVTFTSNNNNGEFKRDVYIQSNDSTRPKVDVVFTGNIYAVLQAVPRYITFGKHYLHDFGERMVFIRNTGHDPVRILSYKTADAQLSLSLNKQVIVPNDSLLMKVVLRPERPGKLLGQIEVQTDSPVKPVLKISYVGTIIDKFKVKRKN